MPAERWLLAALTCSGLAGLVYEIAWTRLLTLHLGHTTAAVSTVTAAFMCGLGLGGVLGGRIATTLNPRQALRTYALLELMVVLSALSIPWMLALLVPVFAWAYGEAGGGSVFVVVRIVSTFAMLLVPSAWPSRRRRDRADRPAGFMPRTPLGPRLVRWPPVSCSFPSSGCVAPY